MHKRKKFRKILNIFLCVLSIAIVFSVTALADSSSNSFVITEGYYRFNDTISISDSISSSGYYSIVLNFESNGIAYERLLFDEGMLRLYYRETVDGVLGVAAYNFKNDEWYDSDLRDIYVSSDVVLSEDDYEWFMDNLSYNNYLPWILGTMDSVFAVVTDFATFVSENALLLLFTVGLPVCSLGVGLLIRLKERT